MQKKYIFCDNCESKYSIEYEIEEVKKVIVMVCPFCGEEIDYEEVLEDNYIEYDMWEDEE